MVAIKLLIQLCLTHSLVWFLGVLMAKNYPHLKPSELALLPLRELLHRYERIRDSLIFDDFDLLELNRFQHVFTQT